MTYMLVLGYVVLTALIVMLVACVGMVIYLIVRGIISGSI